MRQNLKMTTALVAALSLVAPSAITAQQATITADTSAECPSDAGTLCAELETLNQRKADIEQSVADGDAAITEQAPAMLADVEAQIAETQAKIDELAGRIKKGGDLVAEAKLKLKAQAEILDLRGRIKKLVKPGKVPKKPETPGGDVDLVCVYLTIIEGLLKANGKAKSICCPICTGKRLREQYTLNAETLATFLTQHQGDAQDYEEAVTGSKSWASRTLKSSSKPAPRLYCPT